MVARKLIDRPLRLAYQSFGRVTGMELYQERLEEVVRAAASPQTVIDVLRLPNAIVAGKGFASAQAMEVPALLRSLKRAVDDGYEAIAIGNGFDPGLWEARELFDVPVLGLFETVALFSLRVGWRFGVLCSGASGVARVEEIAARYGIAGRMVRPVAIGVTVPDVVAALSDIEFAKRIVGSLHPLVADLKERGAEVVAVASGALDVFLSTQESVSSDLPILPSVRILVRELETSAWFARLGMNQVSRAGRFAKPPKEVMNTLDGD